MKFQLLSGKHQTGKTKNLVTYAAKDQRTGLYRKDLNGKDLSDIVETELDLAKRFGKNKFKLLKD